MVLIKESSWSSQKNEILQQAVELKFIFKSPSSNDVVEAKSISSSSLTLSDVEDDSNSILMLTLDQWFPTYGSRPQVWLH